MLKRLAMVFGGTFVLVGLLGFVPNPLIGADGFFMANTAHNVAHVLTGALLLFAGSQSERMAYTTLVAFGAVYVLLAVLGYATVGAEGHTNLLGFLHINGSDNWLHLLLGVVLIVSALGGKSTRHAHVH